MKLDRTAEYHRISLEKFLESVETTPENTVNMMSLSGGAFRGALQYWVIYFLLLNFTYRTIYGVSIGSINGIMASMSKMDTLLDFWNNVDGKSAFLRFRTFYLVGWATGVVRLLKFAGFRIIGGLYSMRPLEKKLEQHIRLEDVKIPFVAGVVAANSGNYYNLDTRQMRHDKRAVKAVLASSCMAPYMQPPLIALEEGGEPEIGFDGGYRNIFPIPDEEALKFRQEGKRVVIHAIGCAPLDRVHRVSSSKVDGFLEIAIRGIEILEAEVYSTDLIQLQKAAGENGVVYLWVPSKNPGESFDASKETIQMRLEEGLSMWKEGPYVLPGLA